jgi:methyl-accepting chemotaxis protein
VNHVGDELHRRNKLLVKLLWGSLVLGLIVNLASKVDQSIIILLATVGTAICLFTNVLVWKKKWVSYVMYIVMFGLAVLTFLIISTIPKISTYLMIYYSLAIISLYHDHRPILYTGLIGMGYTNYFFFTYQTTMFAGFNLQSLIAFNLFLILITGALVAQSKIGQRMRTQAEENHQQALQAKNQMEEVFGQVRSSIEGSSRFSLQIHENMNVTGRISKEVGMAFSEIASGVESQSASVNDISHSMHEVDQDIRSVAAAAESMRDLSKANADEASIGNTQMAKLTEEMQRVNLIIQSVVQLMNELNGRNQQIGDILNTIHDISSQTNLLALNAAIEAARAGEHGRGFAVVSDEVRKLAESSRQATEEIGAILGEIQLKTKEAVQQVHSGQTAVAASKEAAVGVESIIGDISTNTEKVLLQANQIEEMIKRLKESSAVIVGEITSVSSITEQSAASVQEVLASIEEQNDRVQQIMSNFEQLEQQTSSLNKLVADQK